MIPLWLICYGGLSISRKKSLNRLLPTKGLPVYLPAPILFLARDSVPCVSHNNRIQNMFYLFLLITIFIAHYLPSQYFILFIYALKNQFFCSHVQFNRFYRLI